MNNISAEVYFRKRHEMKIMRRYYFQFRELLMNIEEGYHELIKFSSEDIICNNFAKNSND